MNEHQQSHSAVTQKKKHHEKKMLTLNLARYCKWPESLTLQHNFSFLKRGTSKCLKTHQHQIETVF